MFLLGLGEFVELDEDMAIGGYVVVAAAVEVGLEGIDADEDAIESVLSEEDGVWGVEAFDPFLDWEEGSAGVGFAVLDLFADADDFGGSEGGFEESFEL